jgi:hypothetical protein
LFLAGKRAPAYKIKTLSYACREEMSTGILTNSPLSCIAYAGCGFAREFPHIFKNQSKPDVSIQKNPAAERSSLMALSH